MICRKCKGNVIGTWEIERFDEKIVYRKCLNCGDVDFMNGTHDLKVLTRLNERTRERVTKATRLFSEIPDPMDPH
jgi:RNase P subunit RPR2